MTANSVIFYTITPKPLETIVSLPSYTFLILTGNNKKMHNYYVLIHTL